MWKIKEELSETNHQMICQGAWISDCWSSAVGALPCGTVVSGKGRREPNHEADSW